jgi:hypothetical protein
MTVFNEKSSGGVNCDVNRSVPKTNYAAKNIEMIAKGVEVQTRAFTRAPPWRPFLGIDTASLIPILYFVAPSPYSANGI